VMCTRTHFAPGVFWTVPLSGEGFFEREAYGRAGLINNMQKVRIMKILGGGSGGTIRRHEMR
jgi:hypothetical protein